MCALEIESEVAMHTARGDVYLKEGLISYRIFQGVGGGERHLPH